MRVIAWNKSNLQGGGKVLPSINTSQINGSYKQENFSVFVDLWAYDKVWIIIDRFVQKTCFNYYITTPDTIKISSYIKDNFDVNVFSGYNNKEKNPSYLTRMMNQLVRVIVQRHLLPKAVLVVIEDDLIYNAEYDTYSAGAVYTDILDKLVKRYVEVIQEYKSMLPEKSKKEDFPRFMWLTAPHHDSFEDNSA